MKTALFFQLLLNLFFALILLCLGLFLLLLTPFKVQLEPVLTLLVAYPSQHPWAIPFIAIAFCLFGLSLFSWTSSLLKKGHYETVTGSMKLWVEEGVFDKELRSYWEAKFLDPALSCRAFIRKNKLHIVAELPLQEDNKAKEKLLEKLREEIRSQLQKNIGYFGDFTFSLS